MNKRKNLVLGAVRGYSFQQLQPFVVSLKQTGFTGDICFLHQGLSDETISQLKSHGVMLVPLVYRGAGALNSWSRFWIYIKPFVSIVGNSTWSRNVMKMITPLQTSRFYSYMDFLLSHRDTYANVLLTDVRDVFFQADPFFRFDRNKVQCYEEDGLLKDETQFNLPWIVSLFGNRAADTFLEKKIICSGTILGPLPEMMKYLDSFDALLRKAKVIGIGGSDQGLHNYLIRTQFSNSVDIVKNGTREILTVSNQKTYPLNADGRICDEHGNVVPVIHQYDRHQALVEKLLSTLSKT